MRIKIALTAVSALTLIGGAAVAQEAMDTDGDGLVTWEELSAAYPDLTEETFTLVDTNVDGALDGEELTAARDAGMIPADES